jgi:hypothetical protein
LSVAATVGAAVSSVLAAALGFYFQGRVRAKVTDEAQTTLEDRIAHLGTTMAAASSAMATIQAEMHAQQATARQLAEEVERGRELAALNQEATEAVAAVLRQEVAKGGRRAFWQGLGINALFLIAGSGVTLAITLWIHPLWACH